ncbi:UNVERIFIED_CONTAM: hypothetical protein Sradi_5085100 [Sesamum radiatum]|uniref:GRF-type domain-containing protein n=1 Tax=Sesamum radiatum TaxID=300843 RepID=A0AAW2M2B8_SESRA
MEYTSTGDSSIVRACLCGFEVVIRTSWTNSNPGRRFRSCPGDNGSYCGVFQWIDPPMCLGAKEIIHGLLSRLNDQEKQLNEYRQKDFKKEALEGNLITYNLMGIVASVHHLYASNSVYPRYSHMHVIGSAGFRKSDV